MIKVDKSRPVWFQIKGIEKRFATLMAVENYIIDNSLKSLSLMAIQRINNQWVQVSHIAARMPCILIPIYSEQSNEDGSHDIINYRREYV